MKLEESTGVTSFQTSSTIQFSSSIIAVRLPPPSAYQEAKFQIMSRPTINKEALKAAFEAALNPEVRQPAVPSPSDKKRRASETFEMPPTKLAKAEREVCDSTLICRTLFTILGVALQRGSHRFEDK